MPPVAPLVPSSEDCTAVTLHKRETSAAAGGYWGHPGICTVTFCEGDAQAAFDGLKVRARAVIAANPWIAGHISSSRALMVPPTSDETPPKSGCMLLRLVCAETWIKAPPS